MYISLLHNAVRSVCYKVLIGVFVQKESILVSFDDEINGMITIHTCTNEISLPYGVFTEADHKLFKCSMDTIIKATDRLKYNSC